MKRLPLTLLVVVAIAAGVWGLVAGTAHLGPRLATGPMVQLLSDDGMTLVWVEQPDTPTTVRLVDVRGEPVVSESSIERHGTRVVARFDGLRPETPYRYEIHVAGEVLAGHQVTTAPAGAAPLRVLSFGDSGSGRWEQFELAELMETFEPDVIVHTGDLVYPDGEEEDYAHKFFEPYAPLLATVPFYPCVGNHDYRTEQGGPMFRQFELPRNGPEGATPERHYWFDHGPVRFVAIDTNQTFETLGSQVAPWLDTVLSSSGERWKVVFLHHPVIADGKYGPTYGLWNTLVPVFETHGVSLVLSGHEHSYRRSHPVRAGAVVGPGEGVVYVTTGAGGSSLYAKGSRGLDQIAFRFNQKHGFTIIDVSDERLSLRQVSIDGKTVDEFEIPRFVEAAVTALSEAAERAAPDGP